jgi:site-specific DNA-methyltransferase (adenine-specific)
MSRDVLSEWFDQAHRLALARRDHGLKGIAFRQFAADIGVRGSQAFDLVLLDGHRDVIFTKCEVLERQALIAGKPYRWPGWRTALEMIRPEKAPAKQAEPEVRRQLAEAHRRITELEASSRTHAPVPWQHASDEWSTPKALFEFFDSHFHFDVDVAATAKNAKCKKFWTKADDGLKRQWSAGRSFWLNPPYSEAGKWAKKAHEAAQSGAVVVGLFANRSATGWYRDYVVPSALVVQLHGRVPFGDREIQMSSAPFSSIVVIWPKAEGRRILKHCTPVDVVLLPIPSRRETDRHTGTKRPSRTKSTARKRR